VFLHRFLELAQNEDFQPWHWCWPGQHQPLHSILALINELEESPDDPLADESRQLVDLGLSMCESSHDGGITSAEGDHFDARLLSSGGTEAWNLIKRARDEVWEKLGFDANIFYCPESAGEIDIKADEPRSTFVQPGAYPVPDLTSGSSNTFVQPEVYPVPNAISGSWDTSMTWPTLPITREASRPDDSMMDFTAMGFGQF
jgi:hypothetical protein